MEKHDDKDRIEFETEFNSYYDENLEISKEPSALEKFLIELEKITKESVNEILRKESL